MLKFLNGSIPRFQGQPKDGVLWYESKNDSPPVNIKNLFRTTSEQINSKMNKDKVKLKDMQSNSASNKKANNLKSLQSLDKNLLKLDN